jgi:hypothetical protein
MAFHVSQILSVGPTLCAACGRRLATANVIDYGLVVCAVKLPQCADAVTDHGADPAIDAPESFCNLKCLKKWVNERV